MAAMCSRIQNGGKNDIFLKKMRIWHPILPVPLILVSVYLDVLPYKKYFSVIFKFKMAAKYKEIQNGGQNDA